jgi:ribonuclease BN (tRNA processing enzyme)
MEVCFLGTNGWYDTETGSTVCTLISTPGAVVALDAGGGLAKLDRHLSPQDPRPVYIFLSHFHLDHIVGLHTLMKFKFPQGLTICGPAGTKVILGTFVNSPFTASFSQLQFAVSICELPEEQSKIPFNVEVRELRHPTLTLGYRIEVEGRVVTYCPDTGYCENAVYLSKASDLLIAECAYKNGQFSESWPHLNPETAASIAREADAKRLALVHFDAEIYKTIMDRKEAEGVAQKIFNNTFATTDEMVIEI